MADRPERRFEGAITTPADGGDLPDQSIPPPPERPTRPILIEIAAAILIIGGLTSLLSAVTVPGVIGLALVALNLLTVVVGIFVRLGRWWIVAINVVAIALFIELTALPSPFAALFATMDAIVLFALIRHRAWFDWEPEAAST
jgi:hypothetical protein